MKFLAEMAENLSEGVSSEKDVTSIEGDET